MTDLLSLEYDQVIQLLLKVISEAYPVRQGHIQFYNHLLLQPSAVQIRNMKEKFWNKINNIIYISK